MKLMVIGGGGREHAIIKKLKENPAVEEIYCLPGNGGIAADAVCVPEIGAKDIPAQVEFAKVHRIDYAVVAPDDPLALGAVDALTEAGIPCFGPDKKAAVIEASKAFSKDLMKKYGIPTAKYELFTDADAACAYIDSQGAPIVVKADGLAAGKGVTVALTKEEADEAICECFDGRFGEAGSTVVLEEMMTGPECSMLAFTDGVTMIPMAPSQDHKRAYENDEGPNTGGMGVYSPVPIVTDEEHATMVDIMERAVAGLREEGIDYRGVLYGGFMLTPQGPKLLEFNARFGDPETQVVLPRLETDLVDVMVATAQRRLSEIELSWRPEWAVSVVLASEGYPGDYAKGFEITGIDEANTLPGVHVYHAGTKVEDGKVYTNGGRVLNVTALGGTFEQARDRAYEACDLIDWDGKFMRRDIGARAMRGRSAWES